MTQSTTKTILDEQTERLGEAFGDLLRAYQFRDRNEICCHDVSVSQCYTMDALDRHGPLAMGEIGKHLYLDVSTVTRLVDQLTKMGYLERVPDPDDRRVIRAKLTRSGTASINRIRGSLLDDYRDVLEAIPAASRQDVIEAIELLLRAFTSRDRCAERRPASREARE
jgi:MarR family transcriptional regulator, 2-MHQ and catechol-resistance regulon repressor